MKTTPLRWDIFCRIVDNFGDIGVCWRLARQLVNDHGLEVQLWVDDLSVMAALVPGLSEEKSLQCIDGVRVRRWPEHWRDQPVTDVVIEAFACTLPAAYLSALAESARPTLWLNLEYLSAEAWVEDCHGLPSPVAQSTTQLKKYFFFPGFTEKTGGLYREQNLLYLRDQFRKNAGNTQFLKSLGADPEPGDLKLSLFSYENPHIGSWLTALSQHSRPIHLFVPEGRVLGDVADWLGLARLVAGQQFHREQLHLYVLPFTTPDEYDRLLWSCDFNIVRGEDSFVRAQWAAAPMLWHIYPQDDDAHRPKLDAFLKLYNQSFSASAAGAVTAFWQDWNRGANPAASWQEVLAHWPAIQAGAQHWCERLAAQKNISQQLVTFAEKQLPFAPRNLS